jgi:hypothetical protein
MMNRSIAEHFDVAAGLVECGNVGGNAFARHGLGGRWRRIWRSVSTDVARVRHYEVLSLGEFRWRASAVLCSRTELPGNALPDDKAPVVPRGGCYRRHSSKGRLWHCPMIPARHAKARSWCATAGRLRGAQQAGDHAR